MPLYQLFEMNHAAMAPARAISDMTKLVFSNPFNPISSAAGAGGHAHQE